MADLYEYSTPELVRLLGSRFKEYRMRCNLTQKEVAELSGIIENMRIEATYKGNYHLYAVIDGKERKFDRTRIM